MIPVQLTFAGLYSYQEGVTIDFDPLLKAGLFGIFGPVGSGKSSILEAIMFVLFDRSTRLNKAGDDRYYNMMNLQSDELSIDFIFKAGANNKNKYRFYFRAQRSRKDFYKVEVKDRSYYQWIQNEWIPIVDAQVMGMTYENFMQTVIIPQGKFREFIDQKPAARTQMLKELFQLQQFDLAPQAFSLLHQVKDKLTFLDGQLSQYQELDESVVQELEQQVRSKEQVIKQQTQQMTTLTEELAQWNQLQQDFQEYQKIQEHLQQLHAEQTFYQDKSNQVKRFELAKTHFESKINLQHGYIEELKQNQSQWKISSEKLEENKRSLLQIEKQIATVQEVLKNKKQWEQQIHDLKLLQQNALRAIDLNHWHKQWQKGQEELDQWNNRAQELKKNQSQNQVELETLKHSETEYQDWQTLQRWWKHTESLNQQLAGFQDSWQQLKKDLHKNEELKSSLKEELKLNQVSEETSKALEQQLDHLKTQQWWQKHAQGLEDGKPCPLCGSEHHPQVAQTQNLQAALQQAHHEKSQMQKLQEAQAERARNIELIDHHLKLQANQAHKLQQQIDQLTASSERHQKELPQRLHQVVLPANMTQKLDEQLHKVEQLQQLRQSFQSRQQEIVSLQDQILEKSQAVQQLALKIEEIKGGIDQNLSLLETVQPSKYQNHTQQQFEQIIKKLEQQLSSAGEKAENLREEQQLINQQIAQEQARKEWLAQQVEEITSKTQQLDQELGGLCKQHSFKGIDAVTSILTLNLDPQQEHEEIARYQGQLQQAQKLHQSLARQIKGKVYQEETHLQIQSQHESLAHELTKLQEHYAGLKHHLKQTTQNFEKKKVYLSDHEKLSLRKDQIQEVSNLLRGNGFINFISSVYLQNLCKMANTRFTQLTSNRLSLELNQQNDFMVRDYLNEGKVRLLKTLSGGQIFQASLCLALALAENVKSMNQSDQSFFFLDEGFGSLDKSSIQVVFETLKTLQKENRVVGIISHVEELQEEIDVYLTVKQVGEAGSSIMASWQQPN